MTVSPRTCGSCTLCCKLFPVPPLDKPAGKWCPHVAQGKGCGIHETRPQLCRGFDCQWLVSEDLGPDWKPERSKFVLSIYPGSNSLVVTVDPAFPAAWRTPQFLPMLRRWAAAALAQGDQVIVFVGDACTVILPDREKELGRIAPGARIVSLKNGRGQFDVEVRHG